MNDVTRVERRRFPRLSPAAAAALFVPAVHEVEVVDISQTGVLFRCRGPLHVGQRAEIRALIAREPFAASIEVVRIERERSVRPSNHARFGARFVALDPHSERTLQQFLFPIR